MPHAVQLRFSVSKPGFGINASRHWRSATGISARLATPPEVAASSQPGGPASRIALLATTTRRLGPALVALVLAALCRTDGLLLSLVVATAWRGRARWWTAVAGPIAALVWAARNRLVAGEGATLLRLRALQALDPTEWLAVKPPVPAGVGERVGFLWEHAGALVRTLGAVTLLLPLPFVVFAAYGVWRAGRDGPWRSTRIVPLYALAMPPLLYLLAPAVAFEGSVFRSLAALWPALAAMAVSGAADLTRRYHRLFLPGLLLTGLAAVELAAGTAPGRFPEPLPDCDALASAGAPEGASVLSYDPIGVSTRCGRPGVILGRTLTPVEVDSLAERYRIDWVLTAPDGYESWTMEAGAFRVPGWTRRGERVWQRGGGAIE